MMVMVFIVKILKAESELHFFHEGRFMGLFCIKEQFGIAVL